MTSDILWLQNVFFQNGHFVMYRHCILNVNLFQGVTMPLVTMLGLIGNILSILVLRSPRIDMKVTLKEMLHTLSKN